MIQITAEEFEKKFANVVLVAKDFEKNPTQENKERFIEVTMEQIMGKLLAQTGEVRGTLSCWVNKKFSKEVIDRLKSLGYEILTNEEYTNTNPHAVSDRFWIKWDHYKTLKEREKAEERRKLGME